MLSPKRERPVLERRGAPQSLSQRSFRSIGARSRVVNAIARTRARTIIYGLVSFGVISGAGLYLICQVLAASGGRRGSALVMLASWWLTLLALATCSSGRRR